MNYLLSIYPEFSVYNFKFAFRKIVVRVDPFLSNIFLSLSCCYCLRTYYICLDNSIPVGWAGVLNNDIRVATHPDHQKKGIGKFLINELMNLYPNSCAKIKVENIASQRLFESCGFKKKSYRDSYLLYML